MSTHLREGRQIVRVAGVDLELLVAGDGPPLLFLHADPGPDSPSDRWLKELARQHRVVAPFHPGFGRLERPTDIREVGDIAYLYLELAASYLPARPVLCGASFGGWIAAEMAVREPGAFAEIVFIAPLGIKPGDRETRDIVDVFAVTDEEFASLAYADPTRGKLELKKLSNEDLAAHFRGRESWAYFGWKPFMHNPRLLRWLGRVRNRALIVTGAQDRLVRAGYHDAFAEALPTAERCRIADAGHYPHIEQPEAVAREIERFRGRGASDNARAPALRRPSAGG